jgi:hypothetical protein
MKIHPVEAVIHVNRETVRHETAKRHFSQLHNHARKKRNILLDLVFCRSPNPISKI